jgi:O-methyltransferase
MIEIIMKISHKILNILDLIKRYRNYFRLQSQHDYHCTPDYYGKSVGNLIDIRNDLEFGSIAKKTVECQRSYLYYDRLWTLYQMMKNIQRIIDYSEKINMVEVGVYKGGTSFFIASIAKKIGFNSFNLYCFDTFEGHKQEDIIREHDSYQKEKKFSDTDFEAVKDFLGVFTEIIMYKGKFQDTSKNIENLHFHFVHLDIDIYLPTLFALNFFNSHMESGGIIVIDDYNKITCSGINKAVDEFLKINKKYLLIPLLSGQCILIKL